MSGSACSECGARLKSDRSPCGLCGWPGNSQPRCGKCDLELISGSKFCHECGVAVRVVPKAPESGKRPANVESGLGVQVAAVFAVAIMFVLSLYMITAVSERRDVPAPASSIPPPPVAQTTATGALAERIAILDEAIAAAAPGAALNLIRQKVTIYVQGERFDLAAEVQQTIADDTDSVEDWTYAGNLYYEWMLEEPDATARARAAASAVDAYQTVLATDPDNLDVRTDMATAYLNTGTPMLGVTEIKRVLEVDPDHLNANFNYGLMLARINRTEVAIEQLQRVLELSPDTSSMHFARAKELIASIRAQAGS